MKLLILAQTPPPLHGQSFMVQMAVEGLSEFGITVSHVPLALSKTAGDIGRWQPAKVWKTLRAGLRARSLARREGFDALYYVPAPGKRGALWRDFLALSLVRSQVPRLVLHWHASGLGEWLDSRATHLEAKWARKILGGADLAIGLSPALRGDLEKLAPRHTAFVSNGIVDPCSRVPMRRGAEGKSCRILFLGACSEEKGLLDLLAAAELLHTQGFPFELTLAGEIAGPIERAAVEQSSRLLGPALRVAGFVTGDAKTRLLASSDLFCFPTHYPHEAQPLVLIEALAHDLPIVATTWRGIPEMLPPGNSLVQPHNPAELAQAIRTARAEPCAEGINRTHFLNNYTRSVHLSRLAGALQGMMLD